MQKNVEKWCNDHPEITDYFKLLNENKIRWAIFAGAAASLLTDNRLPTDIDILIHNDDFKKITKIIPNALITINMQGDIQTGDNKKLHYSCNNIELNLDNTEIDISSNLIESIADNVFELSFNELAFKNRIIIDTPHTTIFITNPFDTIAIKSIMQRGAEQNKFDFTDSQILVAQYQIDKDYISKRSEQMSLTDREFKFLQKAGLTI